MSEGLQFQERFHPELFQLSKTLTRGQLADIWPIPYLLATATENTMYSATVVAV